MLLRRSRLYYSLEWKRVKVIYSWAFSRFATVVSGQFPFRSQNFTMTAAVLLKPFSQASVTACFSSQLLVFHVNRRSLVYALCCCNMLGLSRMTLKQNTVLQEINNLKHSNIESGWHKLWKTSCLPGSMDSHIFQIGKFLTVFDKIWS